jgi:hypothetical protein
MYEIAIFAGDFRVVVSFCESARIEAVFVQFLARNFIAGIRRRSLFLALAGRKK